MAIVGKVLFTIFISKAKKDPDTYLKLVKMDREDPNSMLIGFDCMEWSQIGIYGDTEKKFLENYDYSELEKMGIVIKRNF